MYLTEGLPADSLSQPATPIDQLCITPTSTTAGASHGGELPDLCSVFDNGTPTSMTSHTEEKIEETRGETEGKLNGWGMIAGQFFFFFKLPP